MKGNNIVEIYLVHRDIYYKKWSLFSTSIAAHICHSHCPPSFQKCQKSARVYQGIKWLLLRAKKAFP